MTIEEAVKKSVEGGYVCPNIWTNHIGTDARNMLLLDPEWWRALGKAMGWDEVQYYRKWKKKFGDTSMETKWGKRNEWEWQWSSFIDLLAEGKTPEEFFKNL